MDRTAYQQQLAEKADYLQQLFAGFDMPAPQLFESEPQHYRMRAEFRIWHEGEDISYAMFQPGQKAGGASLIRLQQFPAASESINRLMPELIAAVRTQPLLQHKWYQCEFLSTLSGEILVSMIYHKKLDGHWEQAARALAEQLDIMIIGRSRGQKIVLSQDYVTEQLNVADQTFLYRQTEGGFTQPNAKVCEKMLAWACECANGLGGDLLELYCGNGNFTLPLARKFQRVLATEISKTSVQAAQWSIAANHADNITIARLCAEDFTTAYRGDREFRRLQEQGIRLADYAFSTIFVDPPRAGIDEHTLQLMAGFDHIIYVSCNPETLRNNLSVLHTSHRPVCFALFDQFPYTHHIESGVLLSKR